MALRQGEAAKADRGPAPLHTPPAQLPTDIFLRSCGTGLEYSWKELLDKLSRLLGEPRLASRRLRSTARGKPDTAPQPALSSPAFSPPVSLAASPASCEPPVTVSVAFATWQQGCKVKMVRLDDWAQCHTGRRPRHKDGRQSVARPGARNVLQGVREHQKAFRHSCT